MSVNQFKTELREFVENWCSMREMSIDDPKPRGSAFEEFVFDLLVSRYDFDGATSDENIFSTNERGFDIVLPPSGNSELFIVCQCEMGGYGKKTNTALNIDKMTSWFNRAHDLMDEDWINNQDLQTDLKNLLLDLKKHIEEYRNVKWIYATNNKLHDRSESELAAIQRRSNFKDIHPHIEMEVLDIELLTDLLMETKKIDTDVPDKVVFQHGEGKGIYDSSGNSFFVGLINAKVVNEWYKTHKESLFNQNIRTLLTKNRINADIASTIQKEPKHFRHFNNGVSAICEKLHYDSSARRVTAEKFNVINGAQTVGTLYEQRHSSTLGDVEVLMRITEVKYSSALSTDITRFNNTQNAVSAPDFKSNDDIQIFLEDKFQKYNYPKHFRKLVYRRKRPYLRGKSNEYALSIIQFAKIRRTYLKSSNEQNSNPNDVWRSRPDGGCYEDIFPASGILDNKEFVYFNFMFNVFLRINEQLEKIKKDEGENRKSLTRMVLLGLHAFHQFWKKYSIDFDKYEQIQTGTESVDKPFRQFWKCFYYHLSKQYDQRIVEGNTTAYSFVRSRLICDSIISETLAMYEAAKVINE